MYQKLSENTDLQGEQNKLCWYFKILDECSPGNNEELYEFIGCHRIVGVKQWLRE